MVAGGPNFWNTVQVEMIGFADEKEAKTHGLLRRAVITWTDAEYERVAKLARWIEENFDVPRATSVEFVLSGLTGTWATDPKYATNLVG